jgi:hypothetical protein
VHTRFIALGLICQTEPVVTELIGYLWTDLSNNQLRESQPNCDGVAFVTFGRIYQTEPATELICHQTEQVVRVLDATELICYLWMDLSNRTSCESHNSQLVLRSTCSTGCDKYGPSHIPFVRGLRMVGRCQQLPNCGGQ